MKEKSSTKPARGMRDFLPADIRKREYVIGVIKSVYESYGFEPLETPAVENLETLMGKYGEEGNQLIFKILKRGEKLSETLNSEQVTLNSLADLALRYDLTVPLARVVANYKNDLPKFFKRYQIQPVWRADRPARGRFREFYQCDVDAIGSGSMIVEAEVISAVSEILERLGFDDFIIRVNHRNLLTALLDAAQVPDEKHAEALIALDKLDKIGREGVAKEFIQRGVRPDSAEKLLLFFESLIESDLKNKLGKFSIKKLISLKKRLAEKEKVISGMKTSAEEASRSAYDVKEKVRENNPNVVESMNKIIKDVDEIKGLVPFTGNLIILANLDMFLIDNLGYEPKGISNLLEFLDLSKLTAASNRIIIDPTLARGLSYYTGAIFEINVPDLAGSLGGGGRYDGLIGMFGKEQIPACGFAMGLDRIVTVMEERGMFPAELQSASADVMMTIWNEESVADSLALAQELRAQGLRVLVYPEADKIGKQLKYADSIKVPFVCILGDEEAKESKVKVKNMQTGNEEKVARKEIAAVIKQ